MRLAPQLCYNQPLHPSSEGLHCPALRLSQHMTGLNLLWLHSRSSMQAAGHCGKDEAFSLVVLSQSQA